MHVVSIPDQVRELHLFVDDDEPGRAAAERTAARHTAEGRRVVLRLPPEGFKDWNDVAMEGALA
jgi:DNA primase